MSSTAVLAIRPARAPLPHYPSAAAMVAELRPVEPVYCLYPHVLEQAAARFVAGFPGQVLYAVKANPDPHVLRILWQGGVRHFDTASVPEIELVRATLPGAECHFMAPVRLHGAARRAFTELGVRDFVVDHPAALELLAQEVRLPSTRIFVRLQTASGDSVFDLSSKFGASPAEAVELLRAVERLGAEPAVAFNAGSLVRRAQPYAAGLSSCTETIRASGVTVHAFDVGGGFPLPYPGVPVPELEEFFATIARARAELGLAEDAVLLGEPGRALVVAGVSVVTQVILRRDGRLYLNDGIYGTLSENTLSKGLVMYPTRVLRGDRELAGDPRAFRLYGPTCDSLDVLQAPFPLPAEIRTGDWIEFGMVGAYGSAMRTRFNGFHPETTVEIGAGALPPGAV